MTDQQLEKELDRAKAKMFIGSYGAFYGSLICTSNIIFDKEVPTAKTNGITIKINPDMFMQYDLPFRVFLLAHELDHVALLHGLRQGTRESEIWNEACDYFINSKLKLEGYSWGTAPVLYDPTFDGMCEEEIYDVLIKDSKESPQNILSNDLNGDDSSSIQENQDTVNAVIKAMQIASLSSGDIPGTIEAVVSNFTKSIVPWEHLLENLLTDLANSVRSWNRPKRRYQDIYLPSSKKDIGKLTKVNFYFDVSGSVTDEQLLRASSEVNNIKNKFNPKEFNIIQFDTIIQEEVTITDSDKFEEIEIIGRGGTNLQCVYDHILANRPTAAIIFSDLECFPMDKPDYDLEVIWLVYGNDITPTFGKTILIPD